MSSPECRCDCCIYWRRRVHRVAADADKRAGRAERKRLGVELERDFYRKQYFRMEQAWQKSIKQLKEYKQRLPSIIRWLYK